MKKILVFLLLSVFCVFVYATVTENHTTGTKSTSYTHHKNTAANYSIFKKVSVTFEATDLDSTVTEALDSIYGIVLRIAVDTTGTDTSYTISLRDETDITIFTEDANTVSVADFAFVVFEDDTEGNPWAGVSVGGVMDLVITNAAGLTGMTVHIYYLDFWK